VANVVQVTDALGAIALLLGPAQGGQQHRRENSDDGNDDQQLDQSESRPRL